MDTSELKQPRYNEGDPTPYQEGRAAYADGLDRGENPYDDARQPRASEDWSVGWLDAEEEAADSGGLFGS